MRLATARKSEGLDTFGTPRGSDVTPETQTKSLKCKGKMANESLSWGRKIDIPLWPQKV